MKAASDKPRVRVRALMGRGGPAYDAANTQVSELADWTPGLGTPDGELGPSRDLIVSRIRDLSRNDGWASGALTRTIDNVIGPGLRCKPKPDFLSLQYYSKGFDAKWAAEFSTAAGALWRDWANGIGRWCDASRRLTMPQMIRLAFRHKITEGDALGVLMWRPDRRGYGRADYATCLRLIDPDRLGNPNRTADTMVLRGGVELDADNAAVAYHFRKAHPGEWAPGAEKYVWERVPREMPFGRPIVVHDFDVEREGQTRGGAGLLSPVVARMRMLAKYDGAELGAAVINAILGAYIESPNDPAIVGEALQSEADAEANDRLGSYQEQRGAYHNDSRLSLNGARIPILFPGERINFANAARPSAQYAQFEAAVLRNIAAATGLSAQQVSQNYADVNYSSARAAILEAWKTIERRRADFAAGFCSPIYAAWLEEAISLGRLPLPAGAPDFREERGAYARADFTGPGRGFVDPVKERVGAILGIQNGLSTLEIECAENGGLDWEEVAYQRAIEEERRKALGLPDPIGARATKIMKGRDGAPSTAEDAEDEAAINGDEE